MILGITLEPGNDRNGNPRRGVVAIDGATGRIVGFSQDNYEGVQSVLKRLSKGKKCEMVMSVECPFSEVRRALKWRFLP